MKPFVDKKIEPTKTVAKEKEKATKLTTKKLQKQLQGEFGGGYFSLCNSSMQSGNLMRGISPKKLFEDAH